MAPPAEASYRERYAAFLLRWAKINAALPRLYASIALDRLAQREVTGINVQRLYGFKYSGNMPENPAVIDVMEEIAKQYHPGKIRSDKEARKFLRGWEQRPGRKAKAAQLAAA